MCNELAKEKSRLEDQLADVNRAIANAPSASQLAKLQLEQARLRSQISHVTTLIQQNCPPQAAAVLEVEATPVLSIQKQITRSIEYSNARLVWLGLKPSKVKPATKKKSPAKKAAKKAK